jgi:hypothetical protein
LGKAVVNESAQNVVSTPRGPLYASKRHWLHGGVLLGAFASGPALGWIVGRLLEGVSKSARTGLYLPFPVILLAGYALWSARLKAIAFDGLGRGILIALFRLAVQHKRLEDILPGKERLAARAVKAQKAASSFFRVSVPVALVAGLAAVIMDADAGVTHRAVVVGGACIGYGWTLAWLGRRGYLPIMEEGP